MQDKGCGSLFGWKRKLEALTVKPSGASRAAFPCLIKFLNCSNTGMVGVWLAEGEDEEERSGLAESIVGIWVDGACHRCSWRMGEIEGRCKMKDGLLCKWVGVGVELERRLVRATGAGGCCWAGSWSSGCGNECRGRDRQRASTLGKSDGWRVGDGGEGEGRREVGCFASWMGGLKLRRNKMPRLLRGAGDDDEAGPSVGRDG